MARFKATAYVDGKETEVELDSEKFLTVEQHNVRTKETVRQRLARQAVNIRKELLADDEFTTEVLTAKGVDPKTLKATGGTGDGKLSEADVTRLQEEWRVKELNPIKEQLEQTRKLYGESTTKTLEATLTTAFVDAGFKKNVAARFAKIEAARFDRDEKSGEFAMRNTAGDGFVFSTKATDDRPYKGIEEFAEEFAKDPNNADFLETRGQSGPRLNGGPSGGAPTNLKRSTMNDTQKTEFIDKHGFDAFTKLPEK